MAEPRPTRWRDASSTVSWNTDEAYEYIVQVLGHAEKIPQRYDYTLGTKEMLRRLKARYGAQHGMRCVGLLRWHLGLAEDNEVVDETIWRNWRNYFARHRDGGAPGPATTLQERIRMWDDGNADRMEQPMARQASAPSGAISRSLGRLKRSLSDAVDRFKGK